MEGGGPERAEIHQVQEGTDFLTRVEQQTKQNKERVVFFETTAKRSILPPPPSLFEDRFDGKDLTCTDILWQPTDSKVYKKESIY